MTDIFAIFWHIWRIFSAATDRPIYGALNFYRDSAANLQCGPVAAVLSKKFLGERASAFPVDTCVQSYLYH